MTPTTEELRELLGKATPGPWHYRPQKFDDWGYVRASVRPDGWQPFICQAKSDAKEEVVNAARKAGIDPWGANARLIALAPTLAARVVALETALDGVLSVIDRPQSGPTICMSAEDAINSAANGLDLHLAALGARAILEERG